MAETAMELVQKPKEWLTTVRDVWNETNAEMKKVTWPGRNEVVGTTVVVLVATIVFAVFLWGCDLVFYKGIELLFQKFGATI